MREPKFQSKCPKCGNIDILNEDETKKKVHCQRCYHHYDYELCVICSKQVYGDALCEDCTIDQTELHLNGEV